MSAVLSPSGREFVWARPGAVSVGRVGAAHTLFSAPDVVGAQPLWSPDGRTVAFTREDDAPCINRSGQCPDPQLWVVGADGRRPRLLAHHASGTVRSANGRRVAYRGNVVGSGPRISSLDLETGTLNVLPTDGQPLALSPDGDRLAFHLNQDVYLIAADGSGKRDLGAFDLARWSPGGHLLALIRQGYPSRIAIASGDGARLRVLRVRGDWYVEQIGWRSDGSTIFAVVRSRGGAISIRTVDIRTGVTHLLVKSQPRTAIGTVDWPSHGQSLTYTAWLKYNTHDLWMGVVGGTSAQRLTHDGLDELQPAVSPNGERVALTIRGALGRTWLATVPISGGQPRRLTGATGGEADPTWTADGTRIAFTRERNGVGQLWSVAADGSDPRLLVPAGGNANGVSEADFSPDGELLAYRCGLQLCIARADGSHSQQIDEPAPVAWPTWAPDSHQLAFIDNRGLVVLDATTGATRVAVAGPQNPIDPQTRLSWSPSGDWIAYGRLLVPPAGFGFVTEIAYARADGAGSVDSGLSGPSDSIDPSWTP